MKKCLSILMITMLAVFASCSSDDDKTVYTVTFETDGGSPVPSVQNVEEGSMATAPSTNPVKAGYAFVFWYLSGTTTAYNFQSPINDDIILYAKWQEEATAEYWQVTWNLNGGTWPSGDNHATQVLKGGTLAEPAEPTKVGDTFEGWFKEPALTNKVTFPYDASNVTADFTLYAKWEAAEEPENKGIAMVAATGYGYFILNADGTLLAFGHNNDGQLGTGNTTDVKTPTQVATEVSAIYAGNNDAFIVKTDGSLLGTGLNTAGQLGLGDEINRSNFTAIPVNGVKKIAAGSNHTLILKNNGSLWASGSNFFGQLGVGGVDYTNRKSFMATNLTSGVISVGGGEMHSVALRDDGTVWGAGYTAGGALGEAPPATLYQSFVQIFSGAKAITAGGDHTLILKKDGTVYSSGDNSSGQLGTGMGAGKVKSFTQAIDDSGTPLTKVTTIATGHDFSFAIKEDGTLWATGYNGYGQLGTGDKVNRIVFTKVAFDVKAISAGMSHCLILKNDGTLHIWGETNPHAEPGNPGDPEPDIAFAAGNLVASEPLYQNGFFKGTRVYFSLIVYDAAGRTSITIEEVAKGAPNGNSKQITNKRDIPISGTGTYHLSQIMWSEAGYPDVYSQFTYTVSAHGKSYTTKYSAPYSSYNGAWDHSFRVRGQ